MNYPLQQGAAQIGPEIPQPSVSSKRGSNPHLSLFFSDICKPQREVLLGYSTKVYKAFVIYM